MCIARD